jgi:hypothetical protein
MHSTFLIPFFLLTKLTDIEDFLGVQYYEGEGGGGGGGLVPGTTSLRNKANATQFFCN